MTAAPTPRERMRARAAQGLAAGDPTGWFEHLYADAAGDAGAISWADLEPNPMLARWLQQHPVAPGTRVLVPGCGLGDDAALLAEAGATVTAFDVSPTAVEWARRRHPALPVEWCAADLLRLPTAWRAGFDLVAETYTLQCLPPEPQATAIAALAETVAPGGRVVAIGRLRDEREPPDGPPWPLTRRELRGFVDAGLVEAELRDFLDDEDPPVRRFLATYTRADAAS